MGRPVFEIARDFQDKIFGDLAQAQGFKDNVRDSVLADFKIPEELSKTRLNATNNQFDLQNRMNTFQSDLEANKLKSQFDVKTGQEANDTFAEESRLRALTRANKLAEENQAREKYKYLADHADQSFELMHTGVEAEIAKNKANIADNMNTFEKYRADSEFNTIMSEIPDWDSLPKGQRDMLLWDKAKSKNISRGGLETVKLRIREDLSEDIAALKYFDELMFEKTSATTQSDVAKYNAMVNKFILSLRNVDTQTLTFALSKGILKASDFNPLIADAITQSTDPALLAEQLPLPEDAADQSAVGATPNASPAPANSAASVAPSPEAPVLAAPEPMVQPDAPTENIPESNIIGPEQIAQASNLSIDQVNAVLKTMSSEAQKVILTNPTSPKEADDLIKNLTSLGEMIQRDDTSENGQAILTIIAYRAAEIISKYVAPPKGN
jgi:hypothetical protein